MTTKFTPEQLEHYAQYEYVRASRDYNMFSRQARQITGLTEDEYVFVMKNYAALRKQFEECEADEQADVMKLAEYYTGAD